MKSRSWTSLVLALALCAVVLSFLVPVLRGTSPITLGLDLAGGLVVLLLLTTDRLRSFALFLLAGITASLLTILVTRLLLFFACLAVYLLLQGWVERLAFARSATVASAGARLLVFGGFLLALLGDLLVVLVAMSLLDISLSLPVVAGTARSDRKIPAKGVVCRRSALRLT